MLPRAESYSTEYSYDLNGNLLTLQRNGNQDDANFVMMIDDLAYSYDHGGNSNRLINVADALNHPAGFDDRNRPAQSLKADFEYDGYGNLTVDRNKGIVEITYNHLNLPKKIVFETGEITYLYACPSEIQ